MLADALRLLVAGWVLVLLWRAARVALDHRDLLVLVWSRIRLRHLAGSVALLVAVATLAAVLIRFVPGAELGLGAVVGFSGNAVFAPLGEAAARIAPPSTGPDWALVGLTSAFLGLLAGVLPWLAFVEEEVFRAGLERAGLARELLTAAVFGAAHLVMLVPLGAAAAVGAAGFVYGRIYRRAFAAADGSRLPRPVADAFRPTKRSARAAAEARADTGLLDRLTGDPGGAALGIVDRTPERRQAAAVLASTVWHTTFNTTIVVLLWLTVLLTELA